MKGNQFEGNLKEFLAKNYMQRIQNFVESPNIEIMKKNLMFFPIFFRLQDKFFVQICNLKFTHFFCSYLNQMVARSPGSMCCSLQQATEEYGSIPSNDFFSSANSSHPL